MQALTLHADWAPRQGYAPAAKELETRHVRNAHMVWRNPRIELGPAPEPGLDAAQVRIQVAAVGICGSDMHMYEADDDGYMIYPGYATAPNILGHEFAGRVVETGVAVRDLRPGDLVAVEEIQWCGECVSCRKGFVNHCEFMGEIGFTMPGAMAEYIAVRERYCWKLDELAEALGSEEEALVMGAMVEPTGVSYQGLFNRSGTWLPGHHVVIFGAGPIGLAAEALAIAAGACQVIVVDPSASRRAIATRMGASSVLDPDAVDLNQALLELTRGRGVDYVVECAGFADKTLQPLEACLAVNATLIDIGMGGERPTLPLVTYKQRGVQLVGSLGHAGKGVFQNVIRLMTAGRIDMRRMVSERLPLHDAIAAFRRLESREDAKIILLPG